MGPDQSPENAGSNDPQAHIERVRALVEHLKTHEAMKPHEEEVGTHVAALEQELGSEQPHPGRLSQLVDGMRVLSMEATEGLIHSGAMNLLNEILGTGVPPVKP